MLRILAKYRLTGILRFLSHAETLRVFQRACIRAGIELVYSKGFNPHPRLSLALPRPVGVETESDLLAVWIERPSEPEEFDSASFCGRLRAQLPEGFEILELSAAKSTKVPRPLAAVYRFAVEEGRMEELARRIDSIRRAKSLPVVRAGKPGRRSVGPAVQLEAKDLLGPIELKAVSGRGLFVDVTCRLEDARSLRMEELAALLDLGAEKLVAPVKRTAVRWNYR